MSLIAFLLSLFFTGLIVGALARLALPGRDPMPIWATIGIGIAGSFLAGLVAMALFDGRPRGSLLLSVVFAAGLVYLVRRSRGGSLTRPGDRHGRHGGSPLSGRH
ncbi:MAG TPA: hypothetical protein VM266_08385 [Solirubrobacteraceae bacterium]|nr:hypothetical protein [Solirubrobacteraceae bacterium]